MFKFFKKKKAYAAMFVDFECWAYSLKNMYGLKPDIKNLYDVLSEQYDLKRIYFFGDFTAPQLRPYIDDIRSIGGVAVDTLNPNSVHKKDFTDVIMLDYIYQDIDDKPKTDVYILFTGDGHFASVATYLKLKKKKRVLVYGVKGSVSTKLSNVADECVAFPAEHQPIFEVKRAVISNLDFLASSPRVKAATFSKTVAEVARVYNVSEDATKAALIELINEGIVRKVVKTIKVGVTITALSVDWPAARKAGLWDGPSDVKYSKGDTCYA